MSNGGRFTSCDGKTRVDVCTYRNERWLRISATDQPDRFCRMFSEQSFPQLVKIYSFLDGAGCLNRGTLEKTHGSSIHLEAHPMLDGLESTQRAIRGVPQRVKNSGLCWYCAMCFVMFFCKQMRELLLARFPPKLQALAANVLRDREAAERFRRHLYDVYALGDRPGQPPEKDGQNGCSQLFILLARFDIPTIRLFAPRMFEIVDPVVDQQGVAHSLRTVAAPNEPCLLVVRCFRTKWQPKRRLTYRGKRYKLMGLFIGSEHCGHQIGVSTCDMRVCRWAMTDSDAAQHDIGPMFWMIRQRNGESREAFKARWRKMWADILPGIVFGRNSVCDMNPINRPTHELERYSKRRSTKAAAGVVNTDYIYLHAPQMQTTA